MARIIDVNTDNALTDSLMFGLPDHSLVQSMANTVNNFVKTVGDVGSQLINIGLETYRQTSSAEAIQKIKRSMAENSHAMAVPDGVYYTISDPADFVKANDVMRTVIMSHPIFSSAAMKGYIDGFGVKDHYAEIGSKDVVQNRDYLEAFNGVIDPNDSEDLFLYFNPDEIDYEEEIKEHIRNTTLLALRTYDEDEDPTSI